MRFCVRATSMCSTLHLSREVQFLSDDGILFYFSGQLLNQTEKHRWHQVCMQTEGQVYNQTFPKSTSVFKGKLEEERKWLHLFTALSIVYNLLPRQIGYNSSSYEHQWCKL